MRALACFHLLPFIFYQIEFWPCGSTSQTLADELHDAMQSAFARCGQQLRRLNGALQLRFVGKNGEVKDKSDRMPASFTFHLLTDRVLAVRFHQSNIG